MRAPRKFRRCRVLPPSARARRPFVRRLEEACALAAGNVPRRGVVVSCCYRARARGVHSAMPMFKTLKACPEAAAVKPDMKKHAAVGWEVRAMMRG